MVAGLCFDPIDDKLINQYAKNYPFIIKVHKLQRVINCFDFFDVSKENWLDNPVILSKSENENPEDFKNSVKEAFESFGIDELETISDYPNEDIKSARDYLP